MAEAKDIKFEIQVRSAGRWTIYTDSSTKLRAISEAKSLLGSGKFEAVKVTEDRGQMAEMIAKAGVKPLERIDVLEALVREAKDRAESLESLDGYLGHLSGRG